MKLLPGMRDHVAPPLIAHQGGWDEIILFFGAPITLFVLLRWLGLRKERREQAKAAEHGAGGEEGE
jgi:hypothetical protein